jgi:hypothetical protein
MIAMKTRKIVIGKYCKKSAPDSWRVREFNPGDELYVMIVNWPGKPHRSGSVGDITSPKGHKKWSIWNHGDIDLAWIFNADEISELIISADDPELDQIVGAKPPFKISTF